MSSHDMMLLDLMLFRTAAFYQLTERSERRRSVADLERFFFRLCGILQPKLFIEVGALDAATSVRARYHLPDAQIVAFEANPQNYERHQSNPELVTQRIDYRHAALSSSTGPTTFNVIVSDRAAADGEGSLLRPIATNETHEPFTVSGYRLDALFPVQEDDFCSIWMDVEGASREVLSGAEALLPNVSVLFIEVEDREIWGTQWLSRDVTNFLQRYKLIPVARDFQSRYQYNVVYVQQSLLLFDRFRFAYAEYQSLVGTKASLKPAASER